jgi:hypothetical protein
VFGKPNPNQNAAPPPRRKAADVARILGGGLVQVIITSIQPLTFYLFLNDKPISQMDVESLTLSIDAPGSENPMGGIYATLAFQATNVTGEKAIQSISLFPSTIEIVGAGRRISVTAKNAESIEDMWVDLGLNPDGTGNEVKGLRSLRVLITDGIVDAKLTWEDGETEDLMPQ